MIKKTPTPQPGLGVDARGGAVIDPTANVQALNEASSQRQDDLRALTKELFDAKIAGLAETIKTFAAHQRELDRAESERLNSIRQVDREDVAKTAAANQSAIATLAQQTTTLAETLRTQVATTAAAAEARQQASAGELNKRLSALELAASASSGKQAVVDPQMERLSALVESMASSQDRRGGKQQGMSDTVKILITGIGVLGTVIMIATALITLVLFLNRDNQQPPIYVPAPAGTTLPSAPPANVPR